MARTAITNSFTLNKMSINFKQMRGKAVRNPSMVKSMNETYSSKVSPNVADVMDKHFKNLKSQLTRLLDRGLPGAEHGGNISIRYKQPHRGQYKWSNFTKQWDKLSETTLEMKSGHGSESYFWYDYGHLAADASRVRFAKPHARKPKMKQNKDGSIDYSTLYSFTNLPSPMDTMVLQPFIQGAKAAAEVPTVGQMLGGMEPFVKRTEAEYNEAVASMLATTPLKRMAVLEAKRPFVVELSARLGRTLHEDLNKKDFNR